VEEPIPASPTGGLRCGRSRGPRRRDRGIAV